MHVFMYSKSFTYFNISFMDAIEKFIYYIKTQKLNLTWFILYILVNKTADFFFWRNRKNNMFSKTCFYFFLRYKMLCKKIIKAVWLHPVLFFLVYWYFQDISYFKKGIAIMNYIKEILSINYIKRRKNYFEIKEKKTPFIFTFANR